MGIRTFLSRVKRKLTGGSSVVVKSKTDETMIDSKELRTIVMDQILSDYVISKSSNKNSSTNKNTSNQYVLKRGVSLIEFNNSFFKIEGYAFFETKDIVSDDLIRKNLIIINKETNQEFVIPLINKKETASDSWVNYKGSINFSSFSDGKPIEVGNYEMLIEVTQFLPDAGGWITKRDTVGKVKNAKNDIIVSTKMYSFSARSNKKFSLTVVHHFAGSYITILSKKLSDIDPLEYSSEEIVVDGLFSRAIKRYLFNLFYKYYHLYPVNKRKISFLSDSRIDISGNFEYIYRKLLEKNLNFDIRFYLKSSIKEKKSLSEIRILAKAIATSKYIIVDDFYPLIYPLTIRDKAELIQVWHAVGAFKTFGYSRVGMPGGPKPDSINHKNYTRALVSSHNIADKYAEGFGIPVSNILPIGIPRTDLFFDEREKEAVMNKVHNELPFIKNKKVILFAPTFRGNGQQSAYYPYEMIDFKKIYDAFSEKGFVFLLKIHPFVQNEANIPYKYADFFYDVSSYREINDLLLVTDVLITDYSSVCFEYALLKKQMIFFSPDLAEYMSSRNFYYDYLDFIPGSFATNTDELITQIKDGKVDSKKLDDFVNYFFDDLDGKSSERFVDYLVNDFYEDDVETDLVNSRYTADGKFIPSWGEPTNKNQNETNELN
jgi:CDP-ribitol ribitolphosphotransferase